MLRCCLIFFGLLLAWSSPSIACDAQAGEMTYRIEHSVFGTIGHERLIVRCDNGQTIIERTVDVEVRVLLAVLYRRHADYLEVWQGDQLIRFTGLTDDNGKQSFLEADADVNVSLRIDADGDTTEASRSAMPTDPWHRKLIAKTELFDRIDGQLIAVAVTDAGPERLSIDGRWADARKFLVSGERDQVIWFDDQSGIWLKSKIRHPSGDIIIVRQGVDSGSHWAMRANGRSKSHLAAAQD